MADIRNTTSAELRAAIEDLYGQSERLMDSLTEADWARKHGSDWVMSDVPYHLAYFDSLLVARPLELGEGVPESEQVVFDSADAIDGWNADRFAERAPGQTPEQAREQLTEARAAVRQQLDRLTDADLEGRAWMALGGLGWRQARVVLAGCVMHNWSEHMQLRLRLGLDGFRPAPATTNLALDGYFRLMPMTLNREAAQDPFAARFSITDEGGGDWLIRVEGGDCEVMQDTTAKADLTMRMTGENFVRMLNNMSNPMVMMLTRKIRLSGITKMPKFGKILPNPSGDTRMQGELVKI